MPPGHAPPRAPAGPETTRWSTFSGERTVVAVVRTVTSAVRVLDVLPEIFQADPRCDLVFTQDPGSAFNGGVREVLAAAEGQLLPWEQLADLPYHLIVTATENADLSGGTSPVLVLPHGVGFHKYVPDARSSGHRLSGVVPDALLESDRAWLAISHPDQAAQLAAVHPETAGRTVLIGDPCYDQLLASAHRRDGYRRALGLTDEQRLLVVSSTWGEQSLIGRHPRLPDRLLAELPMDRYRVAAILHPNVWFRHSPWTVRAVQRRALDAGLLLIPPTHSWQATLSAADVLIGDHGSVTFYGAALGVPTLLAAFGAESVPGTPVAELGRTAPRLDLRAGVEAQLDRALRERNPHRADALAGQAFAAPGRALELLRAATYRLLDLSEPDVPPPAPLSYPAPRPEVRTVSATRVTTTVTGGPGRWTVSVRRLPAAVTGPGAASGADAESPGTVTHLACGAEERDSRLRESASVLTCPRRTRGTVTALRWIRETLDSLPGCRLAAVPTGGGFLVGLRDGRVVEATVSGPVDDPGLPAAAVYACWRADIPFDDTLTLRVGPRTEDLVLRLRPRPTR